MTGQETAKILAVLKAAFPRQVVELETVKVYASFLADLEWDVAEAAVRQLVSRSRFFPTIAEIREAVSEQLCNLPSEVAAWEQAIAFVRAPRPTVRCPLACDDGILGDGTCPGCQGNGTISQPPPPLQPEVQRALDFIGGTWTVRQGDNLSVLRAQFRDAYRSIRAETVTAVATSPNLLTSAERPQLMTAS